jgi:hypothetical protein
MMLPDRGLLPPPFVGLQILNAELTEILGDSLLGTLRDRLALFFWPKRLVVST